MHDVALSFPPVPSSFSLFSQEQRVGAAKREPAVLKSVGKFLKEQNSCLTGSN